MYGPFHCITQHHFVSVAQLLIILIVILILGMIPLF